MSTQSKSANSSRPPSATSRPPSATPSEGSLKELAVGAPPIVNTSTSLRRQPQQPHQPNSLNNPLNDSLVSNAFPPPEYPTQPRVINHGSIHGGSSGSLGVLGGSHNGGNFSGNYNGNHNGSFSGSYGGNFGGGHNGSFHPGALNGVGSVSLGSVNQGSVNQGASFGGNNGASIGGNQSSSLGLNHSVGFRGSQNSLSGNQSFNGGNQSFNGGSQSLSGSNQSFNSGNQSFNNGNQSFNNGNQSYNGANQSFNGGDGSFLGGKFDPDRSSVEPDGNQGHAPWKMVGGTPATWNHSELVHAILQNNDVLVAWLKEVNLLAKSWSCSKCATPMAWETVTMTGIENQDRYQWRCPRRSCALTTQLRSGSFFDRPFFITLASFMEIIYWWSKGAPMAFVCEETGCNMDFLCYAFCLIREVCAIMVKDFVVGGPGAVTGRSDSMKITINGMVCEGYFISMLPAERKWRQQYGSHAFKHILEHIAVIYDVGCGANLNSSTANSTFASNRSNNVADSRRVKGRFDSRSFNDANKRFRTRGVCGTYAEGAHLSHRDDLSNPWSSGANREAVQQQY